MSNPRPDGPRDDRARHRDRFRAASPDADFIDLAGTEADAPRIERSLATRADRERAEPDGAGPRRTDANDGEGRFTGPSLTFGRLLVEGIAPPMPAAPATRGSRPRHDLATWLLAGTGFVALLASLAVLLASRL